MILIISFVLATITTYFLVKFLNSDWYTGFIDGKDLKANDRKSKEKIKN